MGWKELLLSKEYGYHKGNGVRLYEAGSLGEARIELERALEVLRKIKSFEEEDLEQRLESISQQLTQKSIDKARYYWSEGDLENALNYFQNALGTVRNSLLKDELIIEISRLKLEMEPEEQIQALETKVKESPEEVDHHFDLAMEYALSGYFERAIHELKNVLVLDPENEECYLRLGNAYVDTNRYLEAIEYYKTGLQMSKDMKSQFLYRLGVVYKVSGENAESERYLKSALELDSDHLDALMALAKLYQSTSRLEDAIDYYERVISLDPEDGVTLLIMAGIWESRGYLKNAREIWTEIIEKNCDEDSVEEAKEKLAFHESQY